MLEKLKLMRGSWKTTAAGVLFAVCGGSQMLELIPDQFKGYASWVCLTAVTFGFISAGDAKPAPKAEDGK